MEQASIKGQEGSCLAGFLLKKGYEKHRIKRCAALLNTQRNGHIHQALDEPTQDLKLPATTDAASVHADADYVIDSTISASYVRQLAPGKIHRTAVSQLQPRATEPDLRDHGHLPLVDAGGVRQFSTAFDPKEHKASQGKGY